MIHCQVISKDVALTCAIYQQLEHGAAVGQLVNALYRIKRQFQFWQAFKALRQLTDLVSYGQVEAKLKIFKCSLFCINK
jgi:hypothetical protein